MSDLREALEISFLGCGTAAGCAFIPALALAFIWGVVAIFRWGFS